MYKTSKDIIHFMCCKCYLNEMGKNDATLCACIYLEREGNELFLADKLLIYIILL